MKKTDFSLARLYEIKCRLFAPEDEIVEHVILGVHGFSGDKDSSMLEKLGAMVCDNRGALICFDFPAHGESPVGEDRLTIDNCKEDLLRVMEYASELYPRAEKSVFATSFGGYITILCAEKLGEVSLILRAPAVTMAKVLLENVLCMDEEAFKARGVVDCGYERPLKLPYSFYEDLLRQECIFCKDLLLPTLIIHGDRDDTVPLDDVEAFAMVMRVRLEIIAGADHRFKHPGEAAKILSLTKDFLGL